MISLLLISFNLSGQQSDTIAQQKDLQFDANSLIIPSVLIAYGVAGMGSEEIQRFNTQVKEGINVYVDDNIRLDDFSQYAPFVTVYALNAAGIKGKNKFLDRTLILGTAYFIMGITANGMKRVTQVKRPDSFSRNSLPSGHTATAFMGAEFLYQEYKDVSLWYGITGYLVAAGTGFLRLSNNRHWLTDIAAGAGVGILSTKVAYWVHPLIKRTFLKDEEITDGVMMPFYNGREYGIAVSVVF